MYTLRSFERAWDFLGLLGLNTGYCSLQQSDTPSSQDTVPTSKPWLWHISLLLLLGAGGALAKGARTLGNAAIKGISNVGRAAGNVAKDVAGGLAQAVAGSVSPDQAPDSSETPQGQQSVSNNLNQPSPEAIAMQTAQKRKEIDDQVKQLQDQIRALQQQRNMPASLKI